jgi:hypothetical protein
LQDAPPSQPSLEPGADRSSLHSALQEHRDSSQDMFQHTAIAMEILSTTVDLTLLQTLHADSSMLTSAHRSAHPPTQTAQTALPMQTQDAPTS